MSVGAAAFAATVPADSPGARHAALFVNGLGAADRTWLLGALEPRQRRTLELLLEELARLGLRPARSGPSAGSASSHEPAVALSGMARDLATLPTRTIASRLVLEPDDVVRLVLGRAPDATTRQRILRSFEPVRRDRLAALPIHGGRVSSDGARLRALEAAWSSLPPIDHRTDPASVPRAWRLPRLGVAALEGLGTRWRALRERLVARAEGWS